MRSLASLEMTISVINPIHIPSSPCHAVALRRRVAFVHANEFTILQLHIPFGACPGFFVPPISGKKIRAALLDDFFQKFPHCEHVRGYLHPTKVMQTLRGEIFSTLL